MSRYDDIDDAFDGLETKLDKLANIVLNALNEETSKAMDKAYFEFGEYQRRRITEIFENAVNSFYSSFPPEFYERTYGLYNVLDIKTDESNMVIADDKNGYMDLFDPESMHGDRSGGDLFKKVFMEGWHGGAESGPGHPPGRTPYWRTPYPRYSKWGKPATKTESAYKITVDELKSIEGAEMFDVFKSISQKCNDEAVERVKQNIPKYEEEVYG